MTRHIIKVEYMPASFMKWALVLPCGSRVRLSESITATPLSLIGVAEVEQTADEENGTLRHSVSLAASVRESHAALFSALMKQPVAFLLTAADGTQYVMGLTSAPHPVVRLTDRRVQPSGKTKLTFSAKWSGIHPLLEVV